MSELQVRISAPSAMDTGKNVMAETQYSPVFRRPAGSKSTVHYGPVFQLELLGDGALRKLVSAQVVVKEKLDGTFELHLDTAEAAAPRCLAKPAAVTPAVQVKP